MLAAGALPFGNTSRPHAAARRQPAAAAPALPDSVRWVRDGAEYRAAVLQTYRAATTSVEPPRGRAPGSWAVILDADETVISNLQYQIERAQAVCPSRPRAGAPGSRAAKRRPSPAPLPFSRASASSAAASRSSPTARIGVRGHRGRLQDAPPGVRRDALPPRRRTLGQEPALRRRVGRHDESRRTAARRRGVCRRQHPRLPGSEPGGRQEGRQRSWPLRRRVTSWCPTRCTAAGSNDDAAPRISVFPKCYVDELVAGPAELRRVDSRRRDARRRGRRALRRVLPQLRRARRGAGDGGDGGHRARSRR